jgi:type IV pilus biogenesis protein CpaD/CtpE
MCTYVVVEATTRECEQAWEQQGNTHNKSIAVDNANPELSPNPVACVE